MAFIVVLRFLLRRLSRTRRWRSRVRRSGSLYSPSSPNLWTTVVAEVSDPLSWFTCVIEVPVDHGAGV